MESLAREKKLLAAQIRQLLVLMELFDGELAKVYAKMDASPKVEIPPIRLEEPPIQSQVQPQPCGYGNPL